MVYVYIFVPLFFIGLFLWNIIRSNNRIKKVKEYNRRPNIARVAIWIDLDTIDGERTDFTYSYWKNVKSKSFNKNLDVIVLLLEAGSYNFTASSKSNSKFKNIPLKVNLEAGITYQLGCSDNGVYLIEDSEPDRYNL